MSATLRPASPSDPSPPRGPTLRVVLVALVLSLGLPLLALSSLLIARTHADARERAAELLRDQTRSIALQVDAEFARAEGLLRGLAALRAPSVARPPGRFAAEAREATRVLGDARLELLDSTGRPFAASGRATAPRPAGPPPAAARRALASERVEWSGHEVDPVTGRRAVIGYLALPPDAGEPRLLALTLPPDTFTRLLLGQRLSAGRVAAVIDGAGTIVGRSRRAEELVGRPATPRVLEALSMNDEGTIDPLVNQDGVESVVAFVRAPVSRYAVVVALSSREFEMPLRESLVRSLTLGAILLGLATLAAGLAARHVLRALAQVDAPPTGTSTGLRETDLLATRLAGAARRDAAALEALRDAARRKDEFIAMLGHELRNPLAPLVNAHRLLERTGSLGADGRRALAMAQRQTAHLLRLVDDLLEVSRITQGKIELVRRPVEIGAAVREAVEAAGAEAAARGHAIELEAPPAPVVVDADPVRLAQMLGNLLGNAIKYTADGGRIVVRVVPGVGCVDVQVTDDGIGIDPADLPRLFEPFQQLDATIDRSAGGLGIGLALVRRLAQLHGGSASAASAGRGRGSTFTLRLPRRASPTSGAPAAQAADQSTTPE